MAVTITRRQRRDGGAPEPVGPSRPETHGEDAPRRRQRRRGPSIGTRLIGLVLVVLMPTVGVMLYLVSSWRTASEADAAAEVQRLAAAAAVHQENLLRSTAVLVEAIAATDEVAASSEECSAFLARIHAEKPQYGVIGVADSAGTFWCSSREMSAPVDVSDRDYFIEARQTGAPAVGQFQIGRVSGRPTLPVAHPLAAGGAFAGVVVASIDLSRPAQLAERLDLPDGSAAVVFDDEGVVLMRWPTEEEFVGKRAPERLTEVTAESAQRSVGLDGVERIYGVVPLHPGAGDLTLAVGVPLAGVASASDDNLRAATMWLLAIAVAAATGALVFGRVLLIGPVRRLTHAAERLAAGDREVRAARSGGGELAELAATFDAMAASLERREAELRDAERRALEERYRGLLEVAADAVLVLDADGRVVVCNRGAEDMFDVAAAEVQGRPIGEVLPVLDRGDHAEGGTHDLCWSDRSGALRWAESSFSTSGDGRTTVIVREVTARHEAAAAVAALHDSEERFRLAARHSPIGLALVGLDGSWMDVNPALCRIVGRSAEELSTLTFQDITHPDDLDADLAEVDRLVAGEISGYEIEKRYRHADGRDIWVQLTGTIVRSDDGQPRYFVAQVQDISQRKRSQELLDLVFRASPDLLAIADREAYLLKVNPAWSRLLGWSSDELLERPFLDLLHDEDREATATALEPAVRGARGVQLENRMRTSDGEHVWLQWNALPVPELGLVVVNARDMTAKKAHDAVVAAHREELERSNTELEQFAYVVSHDLSEPLRSISGFATLLEADLADVSGDTGDYLRFIVDGADRMQTLINDLLLFSRVGRGDTTRDPVSLEEVLGEVRRTLAVALEESGGRVVTEALPTVVANGTLMLQLFQNLVGNALKFRNPDVPPHVRVRALPGPDGSWEIVVEDNGIGIAPKYRERVFRVFQRLHTRSSYPGTGVGLAICSKIVRGVGGRIWVDDSELGGASFHLTLPAEEAS